MIRLLLLIGSIFLLGNAGAQTAVEKVAGLPTDECFDLLIDKKGYLWVAHDLGLSRFDGKRFVHFNSPEQGSLSLTGLNEDNWGRIWCNDLAGNVFYVEHEQLKQLRFMQNKNLYPNITTAIVGNELLITSSAGLHVYNLKTRKFRVIEPSNLFTSIAAFEDRAIVNRFTKLFIYRPGMDSLKQIARLPARIAIASQHFLHKNTKADTLFLVENEANSLIKMVSKDDKLNVVNTRFAQEYINTVSIDGKEAWLNTRSYSVNLANGDSIKWGSISDVVTDASGQRWVSTLNRGLGRFIQSNRMSELSHLNLSGGEFITAHTSINGYRLFGTSRGRLLIFKDSHKVYDKIPEHVTGAIDRLIQLNKQECLVATSNKSSVFNLRNYSIQFAVLTGSKGMAKHRDKYYVTMSGGIGVAAYKTGAESFKTISSRRAYAVTFDSTTNMLVFSDVDGCFYLDEDRIIPIKFEKRDIRASSLFYKNGKLYFGTFNEGLIIKENDRFRVVSSEHGLLIRNILRMEAVDENHLFLLGGNKIQLFDTEVDMPVLNNQIGMLPEEKVYTVAKNGDNYDVFFQYGAYEVSAKTPTKITRPELGVFYAVINNIDTIWNSKTVLPYSKNNVQFYFSSPSFRPDGSITYQYRLVGVKNPVWQTYNDNAGVISFSSLEPGTYSFEIYPVVAKSSKQVKITRFQFEIEKPLWLRWWFLSLGALIPALIVGFFFRYKIKQRNKIEKMRDHISSDLHDDIGSVISSINIYSSLAKNKKDPQEYIEIIQRYSQEILAKLDDLVWSINPSNDDYEHLLDRMESFASPVLKAAGINLFFENKIGVAKLKLSLEAKRNIYLLFKEAINNIAKHSAARVCQVKCEIVNDSKFRLVIADDGKGFDKEVAVHSGRNGLMNMTERAKRIGADFNLRSTQGQGAAIELVMPVKRSKLLS